MEAERVGQVGERPAKGLVLFLEDAHILVRQVLGHGRVMSDGFVHTLKRRGFVNAVVSPDYCNFHMNISI